MRWALRRQDKIKAHFYPNGEHVLNRIKQSINNVFELEEDAGARAEKYEGEPYPLLIVPDAEQAGSCIALYVVGKRYDVYTLAFKEFKNDEIVTNHKQIE